MLGVKLPVIAKILRLAIVITAYPAQPCLRCTAELSLDFFLFTAAEDSDRMSQIHIFSVYCVNVDAKVSSSDLWHFKNRSETSGFLWFDFKFMGFLHIKMHFFMIDDHR